FVQEFADRAGDRIYADGAFARLDLDPAGLSQQERLLGHFGRHPATWRRVDDQDPAERAALASLRSGSAAERRRDAGLPPLTAGEEQEFVSRLHTWLDDEQGHRRHYLADLGGQSVGMAGMLVYRRMPKPGASPGVWCYVGNLFVAAEHRNAVSATPADRDARRRTRNGRGSGRAVAVGTVGALVPAQRLR
nr:hypothetical protein [Actinomycetota bacterium]